MNIHEYPENPNDLPRYRIAVMQAAIAGKPVQYSDIFDGCGEWKDFSPGYAPAWDWSWCRYRIKPEPAYKPWTAETFRWPDCLRRRDAGLGPGYSFAVVSAHDTYVKTSDHSDGFSGYCFTWGALLDVCEASYDRGATWVRCGVEVTS